MSGRNGADNKFGVSPFIVGTVLGDGCNYSTIQSAIDDCFAGGGGVVWIRTGTYVEDLTLREGVDLNSTATEGRLPTNPILDQVVVQGQHTFAPNTGTFVECVCQNIAFIDPTGGSAITVSPTGGTFSIFAVKFCGVTSDNGAGSGNSLLVTPDGTSFAFIASQTCNINAGATALNLAGAGQAQAQLFDSSFTSNSNNAITMASAANGVQISYSTGSSSSAFCIEDLTGTGQIFMEHSAISGQTAAISFTIPGGAADSQHCAVGSNGANAIVGTGTFTHADTIFTNVNTFAGTVTQQSLNWQPYAQLGASASPTTVAPRGTASFDSTFFNVTDGWVTLNFIPSSFTWVDQPVSTTVLAGQGNFVTGVGVTLTLPAAPAQGATCKFKATTGSPFVIQANAGQALVTGNVATGAGGTTTSSALGDAMELTFYAAGNFWIANSIVGVWTTV